MIKYLEAYGALQKMARPATWQDMANDMVGYTGCDAQTLLDVWYNQETDEYYYDDGFRDRDYKGGTL